MIVCREQSNRKHEREREEFCVVNTKYLGAEPEVEVEVGLGDEQKMLPDGLGVVRLVTLVLEV